MVDRQFLLALATAVVVFEINTHRNRVEMYSPCPGRVLVELVFFKNEIFLVMEVGLVA